MPGDVDDVVVGMKRRVEHPLRLDQRLQHPALVVAECLQKLAAPDMLERPPVLGNLLTQRVKPPSRLQKPQLPLRIDEPHDTRPVEQHAGPFDRVIAHGGC